MNPTRESNPVEFWLKRLSPISAKTYSSHFNLFLTWLRQQKGYERIDPKALVERQKTATDKYAILDLMQSWVEGLNRTTSGKRIAYETVKSFFLHNRVELPKDKFAIKSDKPSAPSKLGVKDVVHLAMVANVRDRSIILVKWQSLQDTARLMYISKNCGQQIVSQIKDGKCPVRIDIPKRKQNRKPYYVFIGKDAIDALVEYFEKERGWPKKGEPIWLNTQGGPLAISAVNSVWLSLCRRAGLIPKQRAHESKDMRYGYGAHETRDRAKTLLHLEGLKDGLDKDCVEFWMGHEVDKLGYDRFFEDENYMREKYQIAEKYLNILSTPTVPIQVEQQSDEIKQLQETVKQLSSDADNYAEGYANWFISHYADTLLLVGTRLEILKERGFDVSEFEPLLQEAKNKVKQTDDRCRSATMKSEYLECTKTIHEQVQPIIGQIIGLGNRKWGYHLTWTDLVGKWDDGTFKNYGQKAGPGA